jgi:hypothetical protein
MVEGIIRNCDFLEKSDEENKFCSKLAEKGL